MQTLGDVTGETACVMKPAVLPKYVCTDDDLTDGSIRPPELRFEIVDGVVALKLGEHGLERARVDVKIGDAATEVVLFAVPEKIELGAVGPHELAVSIQPVEGHRRILDEVG